MANEIANRSHAGLVMQVFESPGEGEPPPPAVLQAAWGLDVETLQRVSPGVYVVRLTQGLSLSIDPDNAALGRFDFLVLAQSLALPNTVTGFVTVDPFAGPPVNPGPGETLQFPWVVVSVVEAGGSPSDEDAAINLEVRRIPRRGQ